MNEPKNISEIAANLNVPPAQVSRSIRKHLTDSGPGPFYWAGKNMSISLEISTVENLGKNSADNTCPAPVESVKAVVMARLVVEKPGTSQSEGLFKMTTDDDF